MSKENKIKEKEREIQGLKNQIDKRKSLLASNEGKINAMKLTIRRLESNLGIHQKNLTDLANYKRREEPQKVRDEGQVRRLQAEISILKREINRDKISR